MASPFPSPLGLTLPIIPCRYAVGELAAAVEAASLADVRSFQAALLPECLLECLLAGNLDAADARAIVDATTAALPAAAPLDASAIPRRRMRVLPRGRTLRQYVAPNPAEANSAVEVYLQVCAWHARACTPCMYTHSASG